MNTELLKNEAELCDEIFFHREERIYIKGYFGNKSPNFTHGLD